MSLVLLVLAMNFSFLLLAAVVGWILYRKAVDDGTLPSGLTVRGASVAITNVDAVEERRVWVYRGPGGLKAIPAAFTWINRLGWTLNNQVFFQSAPPGTIEIVVGQAYSHRVSMAVLQKHQPVGTSIDWNAYNSWWVPRIVTVSEAQTLQVVEVPPEMQQPEKA